jgi:hypothetical protein
MNIFLRQEIDRMQKVIKIVRITLQDLLLAIDGIIIMNEVHIFITNTSKLVVVRTFKSQILFSHSLITLLSFFILYNEIYNFHI